MPTDPQPDIRTVTLEQFIESASARQPTPGGGAVAAATGALGSAMLAMAVNYTRGSDKFKAVADEMEAAHAELARARAMFMQLMSEDMAAFAGWQEAWRMDQADPARPDALKLATAAAISVPQEIAALALLVLQKIADLADKVNQRLLSDVGVAAVLAEAAIRAAHFNVRVNLDSLESEQETAEIRSEMADQLERARSLLSQVDAKLSAKF